MIQLFHVYKEFSREAQALIDVSLNVDKGEFVYLTGPSGAGKSTLLKLIFCADRPSSGQLLVGGRNIARLSAKAVPYLRRNVGVIFQDFKLLPRRSVEANVAITLEVLGLPERTIRRRVFVMLKDVGLAHKKHQLPQQLSGGEQQRVAIARALVNEPLILLADEPTGSLDSERSTEIMSLIEAANTRGTTVVVATHDRQLIDRGTRRAIALDQGRVTSS